MAEPFRVGFVPGVTPDKWARIWADRMPRQPLRLEPVDEQDAVRLLHAGRLRMCLVRLPVDQEGLHLIPLYDEQPVVVVSREHPVSTYRAIELADLADEHLLQDPEEVPGWRDLATEVADGTRHPVPAMTLPEAIESVAADAGIVIVPLSVARLHHRRDVAHVPVNGLPPTKVGLAWLREAGDDLVETFVGVVRGRTANTSRSGPAGRQPRTGRDPRTDRGKRR